MKESFNHYLTRGYTAITDLECKKCGKPFYVKFPYDRLKPYCETCDNLKEELLNPDYISLSFDVELYERLIDDICDAASRKYMDVINSSRKDDKKIRIDHINDKLIYSLSKAQFCIANHYNTAINNKNVSNVGVAIKYGIMNLYLMDASTNMNAKYKKAKASL